MDIDLPEPHASTSTSTITAPHSMAMDVDDDIQLNIQPENVIPPVPADPPPPRQRATSVPLHPANFTVGAVYDVRMMIHECQAEGGHPEQPARIKHIFDLIVKHGLRDRIKWLPVRQVLKHEAMLVHSEDLWEKVEALQYITDQQRKDSERYYDSLSLYVMPGTTYAARLSCGGVIDAALAVARGELKKSFAIVRPPGHHAEPDQHMGFCFFNNVAVATKVVQMTCANVKKILILDWDVHHGNGTQRAFEEDPNVLFISLHRYEAGTFYPCGPYGSLESCGTGEGKGFSVNIPWPTGGMGDAEYIHAFQKIVMPIAMEYNPDLVMISSGFDAAKGDDLGECEVTPAGYAHMTHMLSSLADGRLVVALEGGYNLESISNSALAVMQVLLGGAPGRLGRLDVSEEGTETVSFVAKQQSRYWKSIDPKGCEPREDYGPLALSIPEILKGWRQHEMYTKYKMMQVPLITPALNEQYASQIMTTPNMLSAKTLVVLVHEFGNLRAELDSSATCDVDLERSYLIDFSKLLVDWVISEEYSLLDVNLFPKNETMEEEHRDGGRYGKKVREENDATKEVLEYLWDNYIQISEAKQIILVGHGPGCSPLIGLLDSRTTSIMKTVKLVIQVCGNGVIPKIPKYEDELTEWYLGHSLVIVPDTHPAVNGALTQKSLRRHGKLSPIPETRPIKLLTRAMPLIRTYVKQLVGGASSAAAANVASSSSTSNGVLNGSSSVPVPVP